MIIISASCRKSASTLIFDYQRTILETASKKTGQLELQKYASGKGYRGRLDLKTFFLLIYLSFRYGDIVLKTHAEPTIYVKFLIILGLCKVTYSYRDPRDVALSMLDHGEKTRQKLSIEDSEAKSKSNKQGFSDIYTLEQTIPRVSSEIDAWYKWQGIKDVMFIRYESFIKDKFKYVKDISEYLGYSLEEDEVRAIYERYESGFNRNFNKGLSERYKSEMKPEEIEFFNQAFQRSLSDMGYAL